MCALWIVLAGVGGLATGLSASWWIIRGDDAPDRGYLQ